jgi:uncharacterized protein
LTTRDRDPWGHPRNARPRDGLGRPLPKGTGGEPRIPDNLALPPDESLKLADELLASGRPFHAHEVLEASWKAAPPAERDFWQGLAQLAVGVTHARRGNARGAMALLRRGTARIRPYARSNPYGVQVQLIAATAESLIERMRGGDLSGAASSPVRLREPPDPPATATTYGHDRLQLGAGRRAARDARLWNFCDVGNLSGWDARPTEWRRDAPGRCTRADKVPRSGLSTR